MASVLEGFLVKLGFSVDKDGLKKFNNSVEETNIRFKSIAKGALAVGTAVTAAFAKSVYDTNKLYLESRNVGSSLVGMQNILQAMKRSGGNVDAVAGAFSNLKEKIISLGAPFEQYLKKNLGVDLYDATGNLRDMSDVMLDIRTRLVDLTQSHGAAYAKMQADAIGLGGAYNDIISDGFLKAINEAKVANAGLGNTLNDNAVVANRLSNAFDRIISSLGMASKQMTVDFIKQTGLDKSLENLASWVEDKSPKVLGFMNSLFSGVGADGKKIDRFKFLKDVAEQIGIGSIQNAALGRAKLIKSALKGTGWGDKLTKYLGIDHMAKWYDDIEDYRQDRFSKSEVNRVWDASADQIEANREGARQKIKAQEESKQEPQNATPKMEPNSPSQNQATQGQSLDSQLLREMYKGDKEREKIARARGIRNNNPGNRVALRGEKSDGRFAVYDTMNEGVLKLMQQLKRYENAGLENVESLLSLYAPSNENNTQAYIQAVAQSMSKTLKADIGGRSRLDLSDPRQLYALTMAIIDHENGRGAADMLGMGVNKGAYYAEAEQASKTKERFRYDVSDKKVASSNSVVINQNIQVNGARDPKLVSDEVQKHTKEALYRAPSVTM